MSAGGGQNADNDRISWSCNACPWTHAAHPIYGWGERDDRAVEVHQTMLCPDAVTADGHACIGDDCPGCAAALARVIQSDDCLCLGVNVCSTCDDTGLVQEQHDGGTHPVHCPEGCHIPPATPDAPA